MSNQYGHSVRFVSANYYRLAWRIKSDGSLRPRAPKLHTRYVDEVSAKRFCERHNLEMPNATRPDEPRPDTEGR